MHSFKICAHSFGHLDGLASIDVFTAPLYEGRSLAKLAHLEHMSPGVWTESNSAGTHNKLLSSRSKISSCFILTSYKNDHVVFSEGIPTVTADNALNFAFI